ncbi:MULTISPECIES: hypothetical protein [Streptosporangium]|uniref:Uncharacterized protein n=1 Tax=Streptosporangium brasiliense TaxID=47480 RepID=A0ABT9RKM4_9ACTN|nr:hypothetical protein [Streptosporangium brasiliense]MDP9869846.1 hypothetical protein [Streptosporangium brasiliense]
MFGGEIALRLLLDHLAYAEHDEEAWAQELRVLESRGAFNSLGVTGAFKTVVPGDHEYGVASIYAEFARDRGWLDLDRTLTAEEYASIRQDVNAWAAQDRTLTEVHEAFGPPSVLFGGSNPLYGKTLAYTTERVTEPMICFHLWNGTDPGTRSSWPPAHNEPILLAVRCGRGPFKDTFTFTPQGSMRRPGTA